MTYISWSSDFPLYPQDYLVILNYLHTFVYWCSGLCMFDMKMFVNKIRLDIGQLFTQSARQGHPCTLDTFLVLKQNPFSNSM